MIRPYDSADQAQLLEVWRRSSDLAHPFLSSEFQDSVGTAIRDIYLSSAETWVHMDGERLVGFLSLVGDGVGGLFVDPECYGQGHGRALMDHACTLRTRLEVEVFEENAIGRRFYDRYGFELLSRGVHAESGQPVLRLVLPEITDIRDLM